MGKFCFVFFYKRSWGCCLLPEGSTPQWEGGVASAPLRCRPVMFFWGRSVLFVYACVHNCACASALYMHAFVCLDPLHF